MEEQLISSSSSTTSEDENGLQQFTINEHYAKAFQYRKEREELAKRTPPPRRFVVGHTRLISLTFSFSLVPSRLQSKKSMAPMPTQTIWTRTILIPSLTRAKTKTAKSSLLPSTLPSCARSHASRRETRASTTLTAMYSRVRLYISISSSPPPSLVLMTPISTEEQGKSGALSAPSRTKKAKAHKPVTLPEQRLAAALDVATSRSVSPEASSSSLPPTHFAEQVALRAETIAAFHADTEGVAEEEVVDEGGLFTLREKTRDEVELEEAEYRAYLQREVGPLEEILDLGEEARVGDEIRWQEDEGSPVRSGESHTGKKKKEKKKGKVVEQRKETDQEFLIKCGALLFLSHV